MTLRMEIVEWWQEELATGEPFDRHEKARHALAVFMDQPGFAERFIEAFGEDIMLSIGQSVIGNRRQAIRRASCASDLITRDQVIAELSVPSPTWARWIERDPISGQDVPLFAMTKAQLYAASDRRALRLSEDIHRIALLNRLADGMQDGQTVAEVYSNDDITAIDAAISADNTLLQPWERFLKGAPVRV